MSKKYAQYVQWLLVTTVCFDYGIWPQTKKSKSARKKYIKNYLKMKILRKKALLHQISVSSYTCDSENSHRGFHGSIMGYPNQVLRPLVTHVFPS